MSIRKAVLGLALILMVCVSVLPYVRVEVLTGLHKNQFEIEYAQTRMVDDIEYLKVMNYSDEVAEVYYVLKEYAAGILATFCYADGIRTMTTWKTV